MSHKVETLALHAGWRADPATGAVAVPIYQTTSYQFQSAEHAANLFALKELGNIYTRIMNPTNDVLEKRVAALDGGVAALALASGQAASAFSIQNLARAGDNVVSSTDLYGGTWNLFANTMKDQGIEVRFVDPADPENFRKATDARTRAYYAETLPNPKLIAFPIAEVAAIGRPLGVPLIMDNTAAPILTRPFEHGAAIIVYSSTKYLGGHGTSIGGLIVDGGNFPWDEHKERQPALNTPDPSYHGAVWSEAVKPLGPIAYILKARTTLLRDLGSAHVAVQRVPHASGRGNAAVADRAPLGQRLRGCGLARQAVCGDERDPSFGSERRSQAAGGEISARGAGRPGRVRDQGRTRGGAQVHRRAQAPLSRRQYRRRAFARHPSGDHNPLATHPAGAASDRRDGRLCAAVDRHRAYRRYSRRPRPGAEGGGVTRAAGAVNAGPRPPTTRSRPAGLALRPGTRRLRSVRPKRYRAPERNSAAFPATTEARSASSALSRQDVAEGSLT